MEHQVRAALYARVSTELQEKEDTIQSQLEALRQYAKEHDHIIIQEFTDEGYSGHYPNPTGTGQAPGRPGAG